jgi:hypothetical protein
MPKPNNDYNRKFRARKQNQEVPPERVPNRFRFAIAEAIQVLARDSEDESIDKDDLKARLEALKNIDDESHPYNRWWEMLESASQSKSVFEIEQCVRQIEVERLSSSSL